MLVRRLPDATVQEFHRLRTHILMDAGELGSRNMTVTWIEVPSGTSQILQSHEEAEQIYVVVAGEGVMSVAGGEESLTVGDLALIPPATEYTVANEGVELLQLLSVQSPAVSVAETMDRQSTAAVGYDDDEY